MIVLRGVEIVPVRAVRHRDPADISLTDKLVEIAVNGRLTDRRVLGRYRCVHGIRSGMIVHPQDGLQYDLTLYCVSCLHKTGRGFYCKLCLTSSENEYII